MKKHCMKQIFLFFILFMSLSVLAQQQQDKTKTVRNADSIFRAEKQRVKDSILRITVKVYMNKEKTLESAVLSKQMSLSQYEKKINEYKDYIFSLDLQLDDYAFHCAKKNTNPAYESENMLDDLYRLYIDALSKMDIETAEGYLDQRVSMDTTNIVRMLQAGLFICHFTDNYNKAETYFKKALSTLNTDSLNSSHAGVIYTCLYVLNKIKGDTIKALSYSQKAWDILKEDPDGIEDYQYNGVLLVSNNNYSAIEKCFYIIIDEDDEPINKDKTEAEMDMYNSMGLIMYYRQNYSYAAYYFFNSMRFLDRDSYEYAARLFYWGLSDNIAYNTLHTGPFYGSMDIWKKIVGNHSREVMKCCRLLDSMYLFIRQDSNLVNEDEYLEFLSDKVFVVDFANEGLNTDKQEISDDFIILELGEWKWDCKSSIFEPGVIPQNAPIDMVVLKDNEISLRHIEDREDLKIEIRPTEDSEKQEILKQYTKWKRKQKMR